MIDKDIIAAKLSEIERRVSKVRTHRLASADEYKQQEDRAELVAFSLMLGVQAAIDLAMHIISDEAWPIAETASASFLRLAEHGVISREVAGRLRSAAAFRNVVAHGYVTLKLEALVEASTLGVSDLEAFVTEVSAFALRE